MNSDVGNWMPISAGILPSINNVVLLSIILASGHKVCGVGSLNDVNGWNIIYMPSNHAFNNFSVSGVDAWCPLPSPFKGDIPDG